MLTLQNVADAIIQRAAGRYDVNSQDGIAQDFPTIEQDSCIFRLKRANMDKAGWRTILLVDLPFSGLQIANRWAADVREVLPDSEAADLYLFLLLNDITNDRAARIETDDRFCRKLVVRESESAAGFLDRSFLASLDPAGNPEALSDPLTSALNTLSAAHPWASQNITALRSELLSGKNGADVVRELSELLGKGEPDQ